MSTKNEPILGVFCPFWSDEGPHFVIPHFQGLMKTLEIKSSVLDLNIEARNSHKMNWLQFVANHDGVWSHPDAIYSFIEESGIFEKLVERITSCRPAWVIFLSVNVASYYAARSLMKMLRGKLKNYNYRIAVGGPICMHLDDGKTAFPKADLVWDGPLENAIPFLVDDKEYAPKKSAFNRFKPDFSGIDFNCYSTPERLPYLINYGCRFHCRFCHEGAQYEHEISRSIENLGEEVKALLDSHSGIRYVRINDGSLNSNHAQFLNILGEMQLSGARWVCNMTPTSRIDLTIAEKMFQSGCIGVNIGVESGSQCVRKLMSKPSTVDIVVSCISALASSGIQISINLMVGYPGELEEDFEETLCFVKKNADLLSAVNAGKAAIFKGTPLFRQTNSLGILLNGDPSRDFIFNRWKLIDNSNNYEIRIDRLQRLNAHLDSLGIKRDSASVQ